uniref:Ribosome-binding factor A, putative n=1 Tax=Theileria annulata TaxID=5874 RepID=A0A3B0MV30_THEAN
MIKTVILRFSRTSINNIKTNKNFKNLNNIINITEDVSFHKKQNSSQFPLNNRWVKNNEMPNSQDSSNKLKNSDIEKYNFKEDLEEKLEFESLKPNPRYQDLTHEERQYIQELTSKARISDPYNSLNVNKVKVDPIRDAKTILKDISSEHKSEMYNEIDELEENNELDNKLVEQNKFDEIVSKIRTKIRLEKKSNSLINKLTIPNVNGEVLDPIKKHVLRRAARISTMLHTHIEQLLTCNKPELLYTHLNGASISINHVEMPTSKSTVKCYYNIISKHDPEEVQKGLDKVSSRLRFMIARKLELGYTPPIRFIKYNRNEFVNVKKKSQLLEYAYNMPLELNSRAIDKGNTKEDSTVYNNEEEKIQIRDGDISDEMSREIQESFHRRYYGYT